jgi:hypothetical protein
MPSNVKLNHGNCSQLIEAIITSQKFYAHSTTKIMLDANVSSKGGIHKRILDISQMRLFNSNDYGHYSIVIL